MSVQCVHFKSNGKRRERLSFYLISHKKEEGDRKSERVLFLYKGMKENHGHSYIRREPRGYTFSPAS